MNYPAIITTIKPGTNTRRTRVTAYAHGTRVSMEYDNTLDSATNHAQAREALNAKINWRDANQLRWTTGVLPDGRTVHVTQGR